MSHIPMPYQNKENKKIRNSRTNPDIKEKIRRASELMMQRNHQAYKDLENK
ncbi:MAG: hypothetical protein LKG17_01840 [Megasphaera sp.]|nr:hypothetical protein [Megasphaera sp.]